MAQFVELDDGVLVNAEDISKVEVTTTRSGVEKVKVKLRDGEIVQSSIPYAVLEKRLKTEKPTMYVTSASEHRP